MKKYVYAFYLQVALVLSQCCYGGTPPPCIEHGPYYGSWSLDSCPSLNNSPSVSPTTLYGNVGDAPCTPTVVAPIYSAGQKEQPITYDCPCQSQCPTVNDAAITYTVSSVQWDPPLPSKWAVIDDPTFTSTAYVNVTSSDSLCPSPGRVDIGSTTWNITGIPVTASLSFNAKNFAEFAAAFSKIESVAPCVGDLSPSVDAEFSKTITSQYCDCQNSSTGNKVKIVGSGSIDFGSVTCDFPFAGVPYVASVNVTANASLNVTYSISGEKSACDPDTDICGNISVSGNFGAGFSVILGSRKILYASGTAQVSVSGSGQICYNTGTQQFHGNGQGCVGSLDLVGKVVLFGGITHSYTAHIEDGYCTDWFTFP